MAAHLRPALMSLLLFTLITGVAYPLVVTGVAQLLFPFQANGSLIVRGGRVVGSALIGQPFDEPGYFWGRPSATSPFPYHAGASSGSNLSPTSPALVSAVRERVRALRAADPTDDAPVPVDLVTASASGLDPHISPAAALYQVPRVARARNMAPGVVRALVERHIEGRFLGVLGEPRVNVLGLNLALDEEAPRS
jgi:potassium-transporting ATPase KdpC subunit